MESPLRREAHGGFGGGGEPCSGDRVCYLPYPTKVPKYGNSLAA
jgi:hypothetical protein